MYAMRYAKINLVFDSVPIDVVSQYTLPRGLRPSLLVNNPLLHPKIGGYSQYVK